MRSRFFWCLPVAGFADMATIGLTACGGGNDGNESQGATALKSTDQQTMEVLAVITPAAAVPTDQFREIDAGTSKDSWAGHYKRGFRSLSLVDTISHVNVVGLAGAPAVDCRAYRKTPAFLHHAHRFHKFEGNRFRFKEPLMARLLVLPRIGLHK